MARNTKVRPKSILVITLFTVVLALIFAFINLNLVGWSLGVAQPIIAITLAVLLMIEAGGVMAFRKSITGKLTTGDVLTLIGFLVAGFTFASGILSFSLVSNVVPMAVTGFFNAVSSISGFATAIIAISLLFAD